MLANTWSWPINHPLIQILSVVMGGPLGRLLIKQFNLFANAMIPAGRRLKKPIDAEMAHYRQALASRERRGASAIFARRITASRVFLAEVEAGLSGLTSMPTLIVWGDAEPGNALQQRRTSFRGLLTRGAPYVGWPLIGPAR